ncbi:MAG: MFS transporter [Clostridia bacterium]|nr:MFS transporter [Clostridia bacterium]
MAAAQNNAKKLHFGMIMTVYLFGIFMGALDTGIVTPARTIIQNNLNVSDKTGIWMITIYTLAYAASIPVMGKLADRFGRKYIYITSILLFGVGSLFCGLSQNFGSFAVLLIARSVQAIGGGGIMPVATAEFGTIFPQEKRGMALGLVGGVYGIANIFGASVGSAILSLFGTNNWQLIFYVNVPISLFVIIAGLVFLPNTRIESTKKIDAFGILLIVLMVLSLLYGLKNIDFFNFAQTIKELSVYPFLIAFVLLLPLFIWAEKRADDPVMNLSYFVNFRIVITLLVSIVSGIILMGVIFVPQFSENALHIASGGGGYFVIILGVFAGIGAPFSGRLTDRIGAKLVLTGGVLLSIAGSLFLMFVTIPSPSFVTVFVSLMLIGLGVGFTMGAPLNYMMLSHTKPEESNSALATLSLVRSIGTAIAPAVMVAFIAHAGGNIQGNIMNLLPKEVSVPALPYAQELTQKMTELKSDPSMKDKLAGLTFPDLNAMTTVKIDMNGSSAKVPADVIELMKTSDVTNITARTKTFASRMFDLTTPSVISDITSGVQKGIDAMQSNRSDLAGQLKDMKKAVSGVTTGITQMRKAVSGIDAGLTGLNQAVTQQKSALKQMSALYAQMAAMAQSGAFGQAMGGAAGAGFSILDMIPPAVRSQIPQSVLDQLKSIKTPAELKAKIDALQSAIHTLEGKIASMKGQRAQLVKSIDETTQKKTGLESAVSGMNSAIKDMDTTISEMQTLKGAVPGAFKQGEQNYLTEIQNRSTQIESSYQSTLNVGFWQIYLTTSIFALAALLLLLIYREKRKKALR